MSRDAGIQLMVCSSMAGAPGPSHPVTLTTVAQEWVYFGRLGVDCEPNTRTKYRSPGGAAMAAAWRGVMSAAGVGGLRASAAHPPAAHPHAITSTTGKLGRGMAIPRQGRSTPDH